MPYLLSLDCSACNTLLAFCATHKSHAENPAITGTIISIPPTSDGTQLRLIPKKFILRVLTSARIPAISTPLNCDWSARNWLSYVPFLILSTTAS